MVKHPLKIAFVLTFALLLYASPSHARPPVADSLLQNFHIRSCCNATISECMAQKPECAIAPRLADFLRWMDSTEAPVERMPQLLQSRYNSFAETQRRNFDLRGWPVIGDPNAPVQAVMYYSSTCPACKINFREILPILTTGSLRGKAKVIVKPFGNNVGNRALIAAHDMGRFTDFMLAISNANVRVDEELIYDIADNMLFDRNMFRMMVEGTDVGMRLEVSSREAEGSGATHVPTYFIEGRRYDSILFARWVADAMEFVYETEFKK